jgi:hypothetical protein
MRLNRQVSFPGFVLGLAAAIACLWPGQGAAESFTLTASNVTIPASSGIGISKFTIQGIPLTGTLLLSCSYAGTPGDAKLPLCPGTPPVVYSVTAGETLTGEIAFYPYGSAVPADRTGKAGVGLSVAGGLLLIAGLRRRLCRGLPAMLAAVCGMVVFMSITACGGNSGSLGTYPFTITATNTAQTNPLSTAASATVSVTVQ